MPLKARPGVVAFGRISNLAGAASSATVCGPLAGSAREPMRLTAEAGEATRASPDTRRPRRVRKDEGKAGVPGRFRGRQTAP